MEIDINLSEFQSKLIEDIRARDTFTEFLSVEADAPDIWSFPERVEHENGYSLVCYDPEFFVINVTWNEGHMMHFLRASALKLFEEEETYDPRPGDRYEEKFLELVNSGGAITELDLETLVDDLRKEFPEWAAEQDRLEEEEYEDE